MAPTDTEKDRTQFDPDEYALGLGRPVSYVRIFTKPSLVGRMTRIQEQVEAIREHSDDEEALYDPEVDGLIEEYDTLQVQLAESATEYTVQGFTSDEVEELAKKARKACKDEADKAAEEARGWAKEQAVREGVTDKSEIREMIARYGRQASAEIVQREIGAHTLAAALVEPKLTIDEVYALPNKIGQQQYNKLMEAFYTATSKDPGTLPKSLRRGKRDADESL